MIVKSDKPAFQMMFSPTVTEEPGVSDQVTTGGAFGSEQEMDAVTEPVPEGVGGPVGGFARSPELLLGSTPGSTQAADPAHLYWKFPRSTSIVQVSVVPMRPLSS